jgi:hypothetical protein
MSFSDTEDCTQVLHTPAGSGGIHWLAGQQIGVPKNLLRSVCSTREALRVFASIRVLYIVGCFNQVSSRIVFAAEIS